MPTTSMLGPLFEVFFLFLCGHMVADYALQSEWVATNKNRHVREKFTTEQQTFQIIWPHLMTAHAFHHGLMVYLVSRSLTLGVIETVAHWVVDFGKCEKWYGFHADQAIHILCKVLWTFLLFKQIV